MDKPPKKNQPSGFSDQVPNEQDSAKPLPPKPSEDDLDFVVTEDGASNAPRVPSIDQPSENDLGIESTADLMEQEAAHRSTENEFDFGETGGPMGSASHGPQDQPLASNGPSGQDEVVGFTSNNANPPDQPDRIEKLTEEQIQEIASRMKRDDAPSPTDFLSEEEKLKLIKNLDSAAPKEEAAKKGFDNAPIVPPSKKEATSPRPGQVQAPTPRPYAPIENDGPPGSVRREESPALSSPSHGIPNSRRLLN